MKTEFVTLNDEKYSIRSYKTTDAKAIAKHANNYNIYKNLRDYFPYPYTEKHAKEWLSFTLSQVPETNFAISTKDELIGGIGVVQQPDVYRYSAELGYWLAEPFWGKGITTQAVITMTNYIFSHFKFNRLFAGVFEGNESSARVLLKAGYKLEARLRNAVYKEEKFMDQMMYVVLKENFVSLSSKKKPG